MDDYELQNDEVFWKTELKFVIDKDIDGWACPKDSSGKLDIRNATTSDDLTDFVNQDLFPYLKSFNNDIQDVKSVRYMISNIFRYITNDIVWNYFREVLNVVDTSISKVMMRCLNSH